MACRLTILAIDLRDEIAFWIREDHGAYGLVVFDVTGAAAQVTVERLSNGFLKIGPQYRHLCQTFE
jgi:hypothetical protein